LHTSGNQIVNAEGNTVRLLGVSWFGLETSTHAPHGLSVRGYKDQMNHMKQLGFNTLRLPFSNEVFDSRSTPMGIDYSLSPDLEGIQGLGLIDKLVDHAGQIGLHIILDHHRSDGGSGPNSNGLWYTDAYPESAWLADWTMLASRYAGNPTVIGADLHNEPHGTASWGSSDSAPDWRLAAERAGNAILAVNPNWLIFVEGVEVAQSGYYWWGGNLSNARRYPVTLDIVGRLVYSPHDYPPSIYGQPWFSNASYPRNLPAVWGRNWGYLFREKIAPVWLGEFGSKLATRRDRLWLKQLISYLDGGIYLGLARGQQGVSWAWWSWNPDSADTGGVLNDDWITVNQTKVGFLAPSLA
jgi:aryl-phospho-beta-D-glucosidase BglC (GH1 family)